ncbi:MULTISPECIES: LCP family protein [Cytobacillus]|uniref:Regulatory protein MsrR n=1 Tax=Cytobacillus firmus TaxID=1399 RepID=A0AA46P1Z0_CYTFI|nr:MULTISPECIES: LCP family protein [Cytobacillus]MCC3648043.1 LCP family protein [Cytobacillus oceanisediminis]MCS0653858.1 LCP family protein [Cytobacillus firmus]MCU1805950.1 LCP family protein [Cytobacillus firmus]UYG94916.1 LCP family protein [Cytobacillus firmus]WHY32731.1 LCP family protein [Cytobacillus firmus]
MKKIMILFAAAAAILSGCMSFQQKENNNARQETEIGESEKVNKEPSAIVNETKNFLLIGVDSRGEEDSRSDAIVLASYEPSGESIKLVSLMRDSYVKIPDYQYMYSKLNHAYYIGGKELLKDTIEQNFGVQIDHTAIIDFKGFTAMLDAIAPDGIEAEVSAAMIEDMGLDLEPGKQKLKGSDILSYVRFRHDGQSDFGRVDRQQEILIGLKDEVMNQFSSPAGLARFPEVISQAMKYVETDLKIEEALSLGVKFLMNPVNDIETLRVPVEDSYENKTYEHAGSVLQLDFEENSEALKQFLDAEKN